MELTTAKVCNPRTLAWAIRKSGLGLNLGGFIEPNGLAQSGSIRTSKSGTTLTVPDGTSRSTINDLVNAHDPKAPPPGDFPADPAPVPPTDWKAEWNAATLPEQKLRVLGRFYGWDA